MLQLAGSQWHLSQVPVQVQRIACTRASLLLSIAKWLVAMRGPQLSCWQMLAASCFFMSPHTGIQPLSVYTSSFPAQRQLPPVSRRRGAVGRAEP